MRERKALETDLSVSRDCAGSRTSISDQSSAGRMSEVSLSSPRQGASPAIRGLGQIVNDAIFEHETGSGQWNDD